MNKVLVTNKKLNIDLSEFNDCIKPISKSFKRDEIILKPSYDDDDIGFLISGTAYLISINLEGQKSIIDYYREGDVFGKRLCPDADINAYYIVAKTKCSALLFPYAKIISCCHKRCEKHIQLIDYILQMSVRRAHIHIDILSQRSTRAKLNYYFKLLSHKNDSRTINLPMSLSDLADYLSADRSAMMRELKKMNDDGLIISHGRKIMLLKNL